jgi:hypothetical protein
LWRWRKVVARLYTDAEMAPPSGASPIRVAIIDDWITKPRHPEELVARSQAVLWRRRVSEMPADHWPWSRASWIRPDLSDQRIAEAAAPPAAVEPPDAPAVHPAYA